MKGGRWWAVLAALIAGTIAVVTAVPWAGGAETVPLPKSMASAGDSITRAFDATWLHLLSASPQYSWSTGSDPEVDSQYQRILDAAPAIRGHVYNHAKTGATMADLDGQVMAAAREGVQYLTVLMGANDLCGSLSSMTSTSAFRAEFAKALSDFFAADRSGRVFVSSIPNLYQLWKTMHGSWSAELTWRVARICPSVLSQSESDAKRQTVADRERAYNAALASICGRYSRCRWDGYAVYRLPFTAGDISEDDHFHPSIAGQNALAAVTWSAGFWPSVR